MTSGRLHLAPLDSAAKAAAVGGPVRDLVGRLESASGMRKDVEAVLAGQRLRLGRPRSADGAVEHLTITAIAPEGFWGWWKSEQGVAVLTEPWTERVVPDPAGYFCALRPPPTR